MQRLDDTDLQILHILQSDPRHPVSRIARSVGLTDNAVRYRLRRLQSAGVLRGFAVILDPTQLGRPVLGVVLLRLTEPLGDLDDLAAGPQVVRVFRCAGGQAAFVLACVEHAAELDGLADRLRARPGVREAECFAVDEIRRYSELSSARPLS
jgi:DNA-binding Lrp family transcriptional regulator